MSKIFFLSDAHLGAQSLEKEARKAEQLVSFLEYYAGQNAVLVIVGDLFDFWFEYRHAIPQRHFHIISLLANLCRSGKEIHYMAGNHDFWLGSFMKNEVGLRLHPDDHVIANDNYKIFIKHGDGLLKKDHLYRAMKKTLRSPVNTFLYRMLHPDLGIPLALFCSHLSREASKDRSGYSDMDYREFAFARIDEGYDFVVLGHTHWPALQQYRNGWYINPGYWMDDFTFAVIENGVPEVLRWRNGAGERFQITLPPGNMQSK
ncbi:MAG TPA: UDP-2,3-diacylglucosamine diphosphatase [bacterium]|mgnify:CR=1 FL=1|nr:UDP-2,3-diacylglucosamine diphosphatase [bacterium]HPN44881.1 UDP-2,3-diacylglucosamine diphosphatase [bacterium]